MLEELFVGGDGGYHGDGGIRPNWRLADARSNQRLHSS